MTPNILGYNICDSCCSIASLETLEKTYFKCFKVKLESFLNLTTGRIPGSPTKIQKGKLYKLLSYVWVSWWCWCWGSQPGMRDLGRVLPVSRFWQLEQREPSPSCHCFLPALGLGLCEEGRSAWRRRGDKGLYWPTPQQQGNAWVFTASGCSEMLQSLMTTDKTF